MTIFYHGTESVFDQFKNCATYFTDNPAIAGVYSVRGSVHADDSFPNIRPCYLDLGTVHELCEAKMIELFGEPSVRDWTSFEDYAYYMQEQGYNSIYLKGVFDYAGEHGLVAYDQWVVFDRKQIKSIFE